MTSNAATTVTYSYATSRICDLVGLIMTYRVRLVMHVVVSSIVATLY